MQITFSGAPVPGLPADYAAGEVLYPALRCQTARRSAACWSISRAAACRPAECRLCCSRYRMAGARRQHAATTC
jgi:hypothetical protein